ncbi:hypothetical protein OVA03_07710 [Asticcacaulis sp. SL142]|uniref:hypothetical protein n=1 Tax=Asticcacaulis sp. SL142 TaxID=2995155 RepID=UPI00226CE7BE|nr:hypothetical protein [Asticcacaulis sp. SL142]WAC49775.1 hypothetical protein OVA03_07710 [Asticcacaulis sp. SL142]
MNFDFECVVYQFYNTNAFSAYRDGVHWTGISTGLLYALAELAFRVAATFPLEDETEPPIILTGATGAGFRYSEADFERGVELGERLFKQAEAFGMTRMRLMNTIWLDAQTLIWRHELFRAPLGHTRFLDANLGLSAIVEIAHGLPTSEDEDVDVKGAQTRSMVRAIAATEPLRNQCLPETLNPISFPFTKLSLVRRRGEDAGHVKNRMCGRIFLLCAGSSPGCRPPANVKSVNWTSVS